MSKQEFYNPFDKMTFTQEHCFLCGEKLRDNLSDEHVFPKWLLSLMNLWNGQITLLNHTQIPYRSLTIPCCKKCNNEDLARLENEIQQAVEHGYSGITGINEKLIYLWVTKIFYGLLYKELSLLTDRRSPEKGSITSPSLLSRYKMLHGFLQSIRMPFIFHEFKPWSIFLLRTHEFDDDYLNFDYHDGLATLTFVIRIKGIGIMACLQDNGAQQEMFSDYFDKLRDIKLHPIQFDELSAKMTYKAYLLNRTPKYIFNLPTEEGKEVIVFSLPLQGFSSKPIYDDWVPKDYAFVLSNYLSKWGYKFEDIYQEPNGVLSFLENEDGSQIKVLDREGKIKYYVS